MCAYAGLMPNYCKLSAYLRPESLRSERSDITDIIDVAGNLVPNPASHQGLNLAKNINSCARTAMRLANQVLAEIG